MSTVGIKLTTFGMLPNALLAEVRSQVGLSMGYFEFQFGSFDILKITLTFDRVPQLAEQWASIPNVVGSISAVARHIFILPCIWIQHHLPLSTQHQVQITNNRHDCLSILNCFVKDPVKIFLVHDFVQGIGQTSWDGREPGRQIRQYV